MTEEQKIQWLKGLIENGANVAQINLGDGTQNFYVSGDVQSPKDDDEQDAEVEKPRGPRKKFLFAFEGCDTKENVKVRIREMQRLCDYLSKHCLKSRKLVCTKDDTLNKTIVCFLFKWMDMGLTAEDPSGGAVFRFLTEDCGIVNEVQEKAYGNRVKEWIKDRNDYDPEVMLTVKDAFK